MTKQNNKQTQGSINPMAAAITGAVVGAGVAAAGAMALKDDKNRAKVKNMIDAVKTHATDHLDKMQTVADEKTSEMKGKAIEGKKAVKKEVSKTQKTNSTK